MEEKNDGCVRESKVLAWLGELLVSKDRDGGRTGDRFGDGMEVWSGWLTEFTLCELSPV